MMSTGDVQGSLRKLESLLRGIKYPGCVDYNGLSKGDPSAVLPILSFTLTSFSPPFAAQLMAAGMELTGKTDLRFTDTLYKVLRDIFHYKPILTKQQFLQWGFSQKKIFVVCDIINLVVQKHNQLKKPRVKWPALHKDSRGEVHHSSPTDSSTRPFVVNHVENPSTVPTNWCHTGVFSSHPQPCPPHDEADSSSPPDHGVIRLTEGEEEQEHTVHLSEVKVRLSAMESQIQSLLSGLDRLSILEKRLEDVERLRNIDKDAGQVIPVRRESWEDLMSRVLLLETKLELSNKQINAPPPCPSPTSSCSSSSTPDASKEDIKSRLESITNMLKSTSSLLKNTESCK